MFAFAVTCPLLLIYDIHTSLMAALNIEFEEDLSPWYHAFFFFFLFFFLFFFPLFPS